MDLFVKQKISSIILLSFLQMLMSVLVEHMTVPTIAATPSVALYAPAEMGMNWKNMEETAQVFFMIFVA